MQEYNMEIKFDPQKHHKNMTLKEVIAIRLKEIEEEKNKKPSTDLSEGGNEKQLDLFSSKEGG